MTIITKIEQSRGCGYRKPGGIYLISGGLAKYCDKLPVPLTVCPCCSTGIKPTRGFTWINSALFAYKPCAGECDNCAMNLQNERMGLIWVGEKFYKTPSDFTGEAAIAGISRRIAQVPKDLQVGKTWICFAHRKAIPAVNADGSIGHSAGIFHAFIPQAIEYVITGKETTEELEKLEERGFTLVRVIKDVDAQTELFK